MTKKPFSATVKEDLNRPHKVTLTEGQISTILYVLEGYINPSDDYSYDPDFREDVDKIFEELEGVVDNYYNVSKCILDGNDYSDCVDTLVDKMKGVNDDYYRIDGY
jgi:hypothetical protein